jgi:hypothetical protein
VVFRGRTRQSATVSINAALGVLGVRAQPPADAFGTLGLGTVRENPEHLDRYADRYADLCDELGV